jgi:predicted  nucleic acid-binding Zn-ribbon protein
LHINDLLRDHERSFKELKKYYNEITSENLELIKGQKYEIAKISGNIQENTKLLAMKKEENRNLEDPLKETQKKRDDLKEQLKQHEKHKMSLQNLKSRLVTLRDKIHKLEMDARELDIEYARVIKEKTDLEEKFEKITLEVKKHTEI